jgi:putative hydrolase of the HAD superfamily
MQREEISEREYWARRASEIGALAGESGWGMRELLTRVGKANPKDAVRAEMRELISACRAHGIKVGILSNEMALFYGDTFLARMELLHFVDTIVDGTHTGILKPDPRSYEQALEAMRLRAEEVLFVDDQFRNIAGAVKVGLKTQHFDLRDIGGSFAAIRARLGLPLQRAR